MILHVDMDAFYASVEQRDDPALRGKPIIVGGSPQGRGVVATASYEARRLGVRSAMPTSQAIRLCPAAIVVRTRMERYVEVSRQIRGIFDRYTPLVEPLSLDEAFLDVGPCKALFGSAEKIGRAIKAAIGAELDLVASVGVAPNKFLAKLASDLEKPDGFTVIPQDRILEILAPLPVSRLWGVGRATLSRFEQVNLHRFADLQALTMQQSQALLGERMGEHFWKLARGIDLRDVQTQREAKTVSHETTFPRDISDLDVLLARLLDLADRVGGRLRRCGARGKTVVIKIRFSDFRTITRSRSLPEPCCDTETLWNTASKMLREALPVGASPGQVASVRLLGVGLTNLGAVKERQLELFSESEPPPAAGRIDMATDAIRKRFGALAVQRGSTVNPPQNRHE